MDSLWQWLYNLPVSATVRESRLVFTTLEWVHLYSMIVLVSVTASLDLRLMGFALGRRPRPPLSHLSRRIWKLALISFLVNFVTGSFLFAQNAPDYYVMNWAFLLKMVLILIAMICNLIVLYRTSKWADSRAVPTIGTRLVGGFLLLLWIGVIAASRWIAFA